MGRVAQTIEQLLPFTKQTSARAALPLVPGMTAPAPEQPYEVYAREGYGQNELVYACVEQLATSAAEPELAAYRQGADDLERLGAHPVLDLLRHPNPHLTQFDMWAAIMMYLGLAGNAYIEKVRSGAGKVVELWLLRPDRVRVLPDPQTFVRGYTYQVGPASYTLPPQDVIHIKNRHALNEYYGMPPLAPIAARVDADNWMRQFVSAFFRNAGVPAGLLNVARPLERQEKELIRARFRSEYGGPAGWHNLLLIDGGDAKYEAMGMPLGQRGLVVPELMNVSEARICMVFGVPLSVVGAVLGVQVSSYANRVSDMQLFWRSTLAPHYQRFGDALTMGLAPEFAGVDEIRFDLSTVQGMSEDRNALVDRTVKAVLAGILTREEGRAELGRDPVPPSDNVYILPANLIPTPVGQELAPPVPEMPGPAEPTNGKLALEEVEG